jgi:hypothetical protein
MIKDEGFKLLLKSHWGLPEVPDRHLTIYQESICVPRLKMPVFFKTTCVTYQTLRARFVVYSDGSKVQIVQSSKRSWLFIIDAPSYERRLEIGKLCYLSVFGLLCELEGKMRLHCAGILRNNKMHIFWGAPGAGKSTLVNCALGHSNNLISSDELLLFDGQVISGVPIKIVLKDTKRGLISIPLDRQILNAPPKKMYRLNPHQVRLKSTPASTWSIFKLSLCLILGVGLHQMLEFHLIPRNLHIWARIFVLRVLRTRQLLGIVKVYDLYPRTLDLR